MTVHSWQGSMSRTEAAQHPRVHRGRRSSLGRAKGLPEEFLQCARQANLPGLLGLFRSDGSVMSPIHGPIDFHPWCIAFAAHAQEARIGLEETWTISDDSTTPTLGLIISWEPTRDYQPLEIFMKVEADEDGKIGLLTLIYDTKRVGAGVEGRKARKVYPRIAEGTAVQAIIINNDGQPVTTPGRVQPSYQHPLDPLLVDSQIDEYRRLLDQRAPEEKVHQFLASHVHFWNGLLRLAGTNNPLFSKVALGGEYVTDFVFYDTGSSGMQWHLVEIEAPGAKLFTASGSPTAPLSRAMTQVRDWTQWVAEQSEAARHLMPGIAFPMGIVFIGRRHELADAKKRRALSALNGNQRQFLVVHTLDYFIDRARSARTWPGLNMPVHAGSDRQLRQSFPPSVRRFAESAMGSGTEFLRDRMVGHHLKDSL